MLDADSILILYNKSHDADAVVINPAHLVRCILERRPEQKPEALKPH